MAIVRFAALSVAIILLSACVATEPQPPSAPVAEPSTSSITVATPSARRSVAAASDAIAEAIPSGDLRSLEPTETETSTPELPSEPSLPPPPGWPRLAGVTSNWQGGCGALYHGTELVGQDDCGPFGFARLLASDPIRVLSGDRLVLRSASGSSFSVRAAAIDREWTIRIAAAAALAGTQDDQRIPSGVGTLLAHGPGPDTAVIVTMPAQTGLYVVQFDGPIVVGEWTFAAGAWFWLLQVV